MSCEAELCPMWTGWGCICAVADLFYEEPEEDEDVSCCGCGHDD